MRSSFLMGIAVCLLGLAMQVRLVLAEEPAVADREKATQKEEKAEKKGDAAKSSDKQGAKKDTSSKEDQQGDDGDKPKKMILASLTLKDSYPEGPGQAGLFGELELNLHKVIERLDQVASDDKVAGVILSIRNPEIGRGKIDELRAAIGRVRKSGKKVYADVQMAMGGDYLLAAACDEIIIPPTGLVTVTGVRMEMMFYKELLSKLGLKADFLQVGDFKGASEPLTRTEMSPEFRKQMEQVVDGYYDQLVDTIAADRKMDKEKVKQLIDRGIFTPDKAKEAGLVDRVVYEDEVKEQLKEALGADEIEIVKDYGKKKMDTDFSGLTGMVKLMELMMGGGQQTRPSKNKKIAVVYAVGMVVPGESTSGLFAQTLGSDTIVKALRKAEEDSKVAAIVLRVDSPGGSALASDLIWHEVVRIKKPIVASMGDIAASGGYYISMGADKIFVEPGTLTGSIGVVGGKIAMGGLMDKIGVSSEVISRGKNSGWLSPTRPFTESEREAMLDMTKDVYQQFTTKAAKGRNMELDRLEELAQGKLYTGRQAVEKKLADQVGTLKEAVAEAKNLAGLKEDEETDLMILPEPKTFFEEVFGGPQLEARIKSLLPEAAAQMGDVGVFGGLMQKEPVLMTLPYRVEIR